MKKFCLSIFFTFLFHFSFAQSFTAPGNKWHYNFCSCFSFPYPNTSVPLEIGTTQNINGHLCAEVLTSGGANYFVYQSNDSVYYYVNALNDFSILYNFNAAVGDTLKIYAGESIFLDSIYMQIDSISTIVINGITKKQMYWSELQNMQSNNLDFGYGQYNSYVEDIGSLFYLFPSSGLVAGAAGLRCFQNSTNVLYQANWAPTCDSVFYLSSDNLEVKNEIQVHPNPFDSKITITANFESSVKIKLIDILGKTVYSSKIENSEINFDFIDKGIYFLFIEDRKSSAMKKIVKL